MNRALLALAAIWIIGGLVVYHAEMSLIAHVYAAMTK